MQKDISQKMLQAHNDVFAETFNELVCNGVKIVNEEDLIPFPTEAVFKDGRGLLRQGSRDVRKADRQGNQYRLIFDLENQSGCDNTMPERIMGYDYAAYEEQIRLIRKREREEGSPAVTERIHGEEKLAPVVTAVLHWGSREEWSGPRRLHEMLRFPPEAEGVVRSLVPDYPINLIYMADLPEDVRGRLHTDIRPLADYMACRNDPEKLEQLMKNRDFRIRHREEFLTVLAAMTGHQQYQKLADILKREEGQADDRSGEEETTMYNIAAELENRGLQRGLKEGLQEGIRILVESCREFDISKESVAVKIIEKYSLSPEETENCMKQYWDV